VVVRYHAQFSAARFTKSSKRKMTSKQLHLALLHCWLQSGYRKERREVHMVPCHGNSMCASLAEKKVNKKRREGRKKIQQVSIQNVTNERKQY